MPRSVLNLIPGMGMVVIMRNKLPDAKVSIKLIPGTVINMMMMK